MKACLVCLCLLLMMAALSGCSEGASVLDVDDANQVVTGARSQFGVLDTLARDALVLEQVDNGFGPVYTSANGEAPCADPAIGSWRHAGEHRIRVVFPARTGGVMRLSSGPVTLEVRHIGARDTPGVVTDRALVYEELFPGAHAIHMAEEQRVEEFILLRDSRAPRTYEYEVKVARGGGEVRQTAGIVEALDRAGNAWLRLDPALIILRDGSRREVLVRLEGSRLRFTLPEDNAGYPALLDPGWSTTGSMIQARRLHVATLLKSGKVLVAGGNGVFLDTLKSAELYDPVSGTWKATGSMIEAREVSTATTLNTGKVLVAGGSRSFGLPPGPELYDPVSGKWKATGSMGGHPPHPRATLLKSGKVLVTGGSKTELYDPASGKWKTTGSMAAARLYHSATLLKSGKVLVAGGYWYSSGGVLASAELYDLTSGKWSGTGSMTKGRKRHTATLLDSGKVLVTAGNDSKGNHLTAEVYDPATGKWSVTGSPNKAVGNHTATLLGTGQVLIAGGRSAIGAFLKNAELYDPSSGTFKDTGKMNKGRAYHLATRLTSGQVLLTGGEGASSSYWPILATELFDPTAGLPCKTSTQCTSGFCSNGICCDLPCKGTCMECVNQGGFGKCVVVAKGKLDLYATVPCTGGDVCDGKGKCLWGKGKSCKQHQDCFLGYCIDFHCCGTICTGTCKTCSLSGSEGSCVFVPAGQQDPGAVLPCATTGVACDGKGACKKTGGQTCASANDCVTGQCVDGVCCDTICAGPCKACALAGTAGTCSPIPAGKPDPGMCKGGQLCDGKGNCRLTNGSKCAAASECLVGHCVDGVCCEDACAGTCTACNNPGKQGSCAYVPAGSPDKNAATPCHGGGTEVCDGKGGCVKNKGQTCTKPTDCRSGYCVDGRCCDSECKDNCLSCKITGKEGTCSPHLAGSDPDQDCLGKDPSCGGKCNGKGKCDYAGLGTSCGVGPCRACDGAGQCNRAPLDDKGCGVLDCDLLDGNCRDYHDLTSDRCLSFGKCKQENHASSCTTFTTIACEGPARDTGPDQRSDRGQASEAGASDQQADEGCGCAVPAEGSPPVALLMMLGLVALMARLRARGKRWWWTTLVVFVATTGCGEQNQPGPAAEVESLLSGLRFRFASLAPRLRSPVPIRESRPGFRSNPAGGDRRPAGRWRRPGHHHVVGEYPLHANGVVRLTSGPVTLEVRNVGAARSRGRLGDGVLVYPEVYPEVDAIHTADEGRVEELLLLKSARAPLSFEYRLEVAGGTGEVQHVGGVVQVLDGRGRCWLRLEPSRIFLPNGESRLVPVRLEDGTLRISLPGDLSYPALLDPGWTTTGKMAQARETHTATMLKTGQLLVAGGYASKFCASTELYDPPTNTWKATWSMSNGRARHRATLLKSGKVLVTGGDGFNATANAELYDPTTGKWKVTASMGQGRIEHTSTLLGTGMVLVAGGAKGGYHSSAELYDPVKGTWKATGSMNVARNYHTATLLKAGQVLVTGGENNKASVLSSAELYDPTAGKWKVTGSLVQARSGPSATLLATGQALVVGGGTWGALTKAELYDPTTGKWTQTGSMSQSRRMHTATSLINGQVLVVGGFGTQGYLFSAELWDPASGKWKTTDKMKAARRLHTATRLSSGKVLVVGGKTYTSYLSSAEQYDPDSGQPCKAASACASGHCADGICCEAACRETCMECVTLAGYGRCMPVALGKQDTSANVPCTGNGACDGTGTCLLGKGKACKQHASCLTAACMDGLCCNALCSQTCWSCSLPGMEGTCSPVPCGQPDLNAKVPCAGANVCNGFGACKAKTGQSCTAAVQCASDFCIDGVCCLSSCTGPCRSCGLAKSKGTCTLIPSGKPDIVPAGSCSGDKVCDGKGSCLLIKGSKCATAKECFSGFCADGRCCDGSCDTACKTCDVAGKEGTCADVPSGSPDKNAAKPCHGGGTETCDGTGGCVKLKGQACSKPTDCLSGYCVDSRCCDSECKDNCMSCKTPGKEGSCSPHPTGSDPDQDCLGKDPDCGGKCDGKGKCAFPGVGTSCGGGQCKACDGAGQCTKTPLDDKACGVLDCDLLDTDCRDFHDLTSDRCLSFGSCKKPNEATTCNAYTQIPCEGPARDRGPAPVPDSGSDRGGDRGQEAGGIPQQPGEGGCGCAVPAATGPTWASWLLLWGLLLMTGRRRRRRRRWLVVSGLLAVVSGCGEQNRTVHDLEARSLLRGVRARFSGHASRLRSGEPIKASRRGFRSMSASRGRQTPGRWRAPGPHRVVGEFPRRANGVVRLTSGPVTLEIRSLGARDRRGGLGDGVLVYPEVFRDTDAFHTASARRVEELLLLRTGRSPRAFEYHLAVVRGGGKVRQQAGVVQVLDSRGNAWLRLEPPRVFFLDGTSREVPARIRGDTLRIALPAGLDSYPALLDPAWTTTGSMTQPRYYHCANLLKSGKVLVTGGGKPGGGYHSSAELYDPATGTWTATGNMSQQRGSFDAVSLTSGQVLLVGGSGKSSYLALSELYDPATGKWKPTGSLIHARKNSRAMVLKSGQVLVAGGYGNSGFLSSAELYDLATGKWKLTGSLSQALLGHSLTLLNTGHVLLTGGRTYGPKKQPSAELYDPAKGTWQATGALNQDRHSHTATPLASGKVLVAGGSIGTNIRTATAELYDPTSKIWKVTGSMSFGCRRAGHAAALLVSGRVLVAGGNTSGCVPSSAEFYTPSSGTWKVTDAMGQVREGGHTMTLLPSRKVLVTGGIVWATSTRLSSAELYDPTSGIPCKHSSQCATGYCVDNVCCQSSCEGACLECVNKGGIGACVPVAKWEKDSNAAVPCVGGDVCDGKGKCLLSKGKLCKQHQDCALGYCVDFYCCESACSGTCQACGLPGSKGNCVFIPAGQLDPSAVVPCSTSGTACNGKGACKKTNGQACSLAGECVSGRCVDGVCCSTACSGMCEDCSLTGIAGTCSPIPAGKPDPAACKKSQVCDGKGFCLLIKGNKCSAASECYSGYCVDGICCVGACTETCKACNVPGKEGSCAKIPAGSPDKTAPAPCNKGGTETCDGMGGCVKLKGQACSKPTDCLSGFCVDGNCCNGECKDNCMSCNVSGKQGTCSPYPAGSDPGKDCQGTDPACGGKCDGKGKCDYPGVGFSCGVGPCRACDGTGQCNLAPLDDKGCGVLDCDLLDGDCRDFHDLTSGRCQSFGKCKPANDPKTCTKYTNLACVDAGPDLGAGKVDLSAAAEAGPGNNHGVEDNGCSCRVAGPAGGPSSLLLVLLLLLCGCVVTRRRA